MSAAAPTSHAVHQQGFGVSAASNLQPGTPREFSIGFGNLSRERSNPMVDDAVAVGGGWAADGGVGTPPGARFREISQHASSPMGSNRFKVVDVSVEHGSGAAKRKRAPTPDFSATNATTSASYAAVHYTPPSSAPDGSVSSAKLPSSGAATVSPQPSSRKLAACEHGQNITNFFPPQGSAGPHSTATAPMTAFSSSSAPAAPATFGAALAVAPPPASDLALAELAETRRQLAEKERQLGERTRALEARDASLAAAEHARDKLQADLEQVRQLDPTMPPTTT